ncbi:hypothetical protein ACMFY2_12045 [Enterobacter cloacae subsp. cloacae]
MTVITIRGEDDVYGLLQQFMHSSDLPDNVRFEFEGWPNFKVKLVGEQFQSTITPTVMKAFLELQAGIYRAFATATYGSPNAAKLTKEERQMLEMVIEVEKEAPNLISTSNRYLKMPVTRWRRNWKVSTF